MDAIFNTFIIIGEIEIGESSIGEEVCIIGVALDGFCVAVDSSLILFIFIGLVAFLFIFEGLCLLMGGHLGYLGYIIQLVFDKMEIIYNG
jgi:hypothetical protein